MKEIEIVVDKGYGEKKIIISDAKISFDASETDLLIEDKKPAMLVIAGNGNYLPPFDKGSRILRELRESSSNDLSTWKLVLPLQLLPNDFFNFDLIQTELNDETLTTEKASWGIWHHSAENENYPDVLFLNFPLWIINSHFKKHGFNQGVYKEILSTIYRTLLSSISAITAYHLDTKYALSNRTLLFSDIGNNLIDKALLNQWNKDDNLSEEIAKIRVKVFTEVLMGWLANSNSFERAFISYGEGMHMHALQRAWDDQADESKDESLEFEEALALRAKNKQLLTRLELNTTIHTSLKYTINSSIQTFNTEPSLSADLIQSRSLVEALTLELCRKHDLKTKESTLDSYLKRLEESKNISTWITSYCHVIRLLGNEAAHCKSEITRRPERPIGKDLVVIHAALYRILSFCLDEM